MGGRKKRKRATRRGVQKEKKMERRRTREKEGMRWRIGRKGWMDGWKRSKVDKGIRAGVLVSEGRKGGRTDGEMDKDSKER